MIPADKITSFFSKKPVTAVYLFGSQARKNTGSMSDIDIGILFNFSENKDSRFEKIVHYRLELGKILDVAEEMIDIVDLNSAPFPISFAVIKGKLLYFRNNLERVLYETKIMALMQTDKYFIEQDYKLTLEKIQQGTYFYGN